MIRRLAVEIEGYLTASLLILQGIKSFEVLEDWLSSSLESLELLEDWLSSSLESLETI